MHECPDCGIICDCDGEDIWTDGPDGRGYRQCRHDCDEDDESDDGASWEDWGYLDDDEPPPYPGYIP